MVGQGLQIVRHTNGTGRTDFPRFGMYRTLEPNPHETSPRKYVLDASDLDHAFALTPVTVGYAWSTKKVTPDTNVRLQDSMAPLSMMRRFPRRTERLGTWMEYILDHTNHVPVLEISSSAGVGAKNSARIKFSLLRLYPLAQTRLRMMGIHPNELRAYSRDPMITAEMRAKEADWHHF